MFLNVIILLVLWQLMIEKYVTEYYLGDMFVLFAEAVNAAWT